MLSYAPLSPLCVCIVCLHANACVCVQKYPDLLQLIPTVLGPDVKSFIMDAEVVAYDFTADKILPFQTLITRARKAC